MGQSRQFDVDGIDSLAGDFIGAVESGLRTAHHFVSLWIVSSLNLVAVMLVDPFQRLFAAAEALRRVALLRPA